MYPTFISKCGTQNQETDVGKLFEDAECICISLEQIFLKHHFHPWHRLSQCWGKAPKDTAIQLTKAYRSSTCHLPE